MWVSLLCLMQNINFKIYTDLQNEVVYLIILILLTTTNQHFLAVLPVDQKLFLFHLIGKYIHTLCLIMFLKHMWWQCAWYAQWSLSKFGPVKFCLNGVNNNFSVLFASNLNVDCLEARLCIIVCVWWANLCPFASCCTKTSHVHLLYKHM